MISLLQVFPVKGCLVGSSKLKKTPNNKPETAAVFFYYTQPNRQFKVLQVFLFAAPYPIPPLPTYERCSPSGGTGQQQAGGNPCQTPGVAERLFSGSVQERRAPLLSGGVVSGEQRWQHTLWWHKTLYCEMFFMKNNPLLHFIWCSLNRTSRQSDGVERPHCCTETQGVAAEAAVGTLRSNSFDEVIAVGLGHVFIALAQEISVVAGITCPKFSFCLVLIGLC